MQLRGIYASLLLIGVASLAWAQKEGEQITTRTSEFTFHPSLRQPAVSELNGKIGYSGGTMESEPGHNFEGSISVPLGEQTGVQIDALYSRISGEDFGGGAGHWFWRNPETGLLGLAGGALWREGVRTYQVGAETAYYWGPITLSAFAGAGSIHYGDSTPFIDTKPVDFVGRIAIDWYLSDNLRLGVSAMSAFANELYRIEAEYQTPIRGLAVTAEAATGSHDYDHCLVGVRWYLGGDKSLLSRQRQDDPPSLVPQILHGLGLYGAEYSSAGRQFLAANPDLSGENWSAGYGLIEVSRVRDIRPVDGGEMPPLPPTDISEILEQETSTGPTSF
jgi:hypothetical protein